MSFQQEVKRIARGATMFVVKKNKPVDVLKGGVLFKLFNINRSLKKDKKNKKNKKIMEEDDEMVDQVNEVRLEFKNLAGKQYIKGIVYDAFLNQVKNKNDYTLLYDHFCILKNNNKYRSEVFNNYINWVQEQFWSRGLQENTCDIITECLNEISEYFKYMNLK